MPADFRVRVVRFTGHRSDLDANIVRGKLGSQLRKLNPEFYSRFFAPERAAGPSGLRNLPRPFVLRVRPTECGIHLFDVELPFAPIAEAFRQKEIVEDRVMEFSLIAAETASRARVTFLTPTELKRGPQPEFDILFAHIRDRISTLRALYQGGPLDIDFKAIAERASQIEMTRCEIQHVAAERTSRATGQTHSLGGFRGVAEYEGDLGEFLPYLEIARWTGVGRQTVWGKGEIACETF